MSSQEPFLSRRCLINDPLLLWVVFRPLKRYEVLTPGPVNMTLFRNQVLEVMMDKMGLYWARVGPKFDDKCPSKERSEDTEETQRRRPCEDGSRAGVRPATAKGTRDCGQPPEAREKALLQSLGREHGSVSTSHFRPLQP